VIAEQVENSRNHTDSSTRPLQTCLKRLHAGTLGAITQEKRRCTFKHVPWSACKDRERHLTDSVKVCCSGCVSRLRLHTAATFISSRRCAKWLEGLLRFCPSACFWRITFACCDFTFNHNTNYNCTTIQGTRIVAVAVCGMGDCERLPSLFLMCRYKSA
jgi:hypothetical protein